jgi:hypothetical protein
VAHFIETCNNAGTYGDHMVKQFVRSIKGNAFDWYIDLKPNSINSWEQLEREFLNVSTGFGVLLVWLSSPIQSSGKRNMLFTTSNDGEISVSTAKFNCLRHLVLRCAFKECIGA